MPNIENISGEGPLLRILRLAAVKRLFLSACAALAFAGTVTVTYPVTAVILPAALVNPRQWRPIALASALGSALGATALVLAFHHWGWAWVYARFPEFASHDSWLKMLDWVSTYGLAALFAIALSPLPQTPALVFFGIVRPEPFGTFVAIMGAKLIKYGVFAWFVSRFPKRFQGTRRSDLEAHP